MKNTLLASAFLLAVLGLVAASAAEEKIPYGNNPAAGKFYEINGFRMYCEIYGSGPPLLVLHGNGQTIRSHARAIAHFAPRFQVIVPESRAHGKSEDASERLTYEMLADDLAALLDTLKVEPALVLGLSDGGINALLLAMRHPQKVARIAASGANLWPDASTLGSYWENAQTRYAKEKDQPRTTRKEQDAWKRFMLPYTEPHIELTALKGITCPTLIISGDRDMIPLEHTLAIYRSLPRAQAGLWVMPLTGHNTFGARAEELNRRVEEFFTQPVAVKR